MSWTRRAIGGVNPPSTARRRLPASLVRMDPNQRSSSPSSRVPMLGPTPPPTPWTYRASYGQPSVMWPPAHVAYSLTSLGLPRRDPPSLGLDLGVVFHRYAQAANDVVAEVPGAVRGHQILAAVLRGTIRSQAALAEQVGVDQSSLVHRLDELERAGLIGRSRDRADRRNHVIVPTEKGRKLYTSIETRLRRAEDQLLGGLAGAEQNVLRDLLGRLARCDNDDSSP